MDEVGMIADSAHHVLIDIMGYEEEPFDFKVMKQDVDRYLYGDKKIQRLQMKIEYQSQCVFFLDSVLTQIRDRQWQIRNAIEFQKLTLGYG